jgi:uncharacterized membrane-anchored protein YitT (DUF2179 family)
MKQQTVHHMRNISSIFLGAFLFAIGINYFAIPFHLGEGGFTGIALLVYYILDWSPGLIIFLLNLPLLLISYKILGKKLFLYTVIGILASYLMLEWTKKLVTIVSLAPPKVDVLLATLYTGILVGVGLGIIFRVGATTGGTDIIARLVNKYVGWSMGRTLFLFDFGVILISSYFIGIEKAMYTLVAIFVSARVVDFVVEGLNASKAVTIISLLADELARTITEKMERGVTLLQGKGGYTGNEKEILYVVVAPNELPKLKQIVHELDPRAFVVVHDARDVHGEGFTYHHPATIAHASKIGNGNRHHNLKHHKK